ncbi:MULTISPECIES: methyltransferase domain-containing protein [Pseudomonas]|uniref:methyltransferase domain-containing protein n=1 Tax=Pseudomonas TaxID=286 RepID=UPI0037427405
MTTARIDFATQLLIDAGIANGMRVLDTGCDSGDVAFLLSGIVGMTGEVVGIDHDKDALGRARNRSNIDHLRIPTIFEYELLDMPESLGSFEAA